MLRVSPESLVLAFGVGLASGTHAAIWGMYKDALHEGFSGARFLRSMMVGAVAATLIQSVLLLPLPRAHALLVLFGMAYALERGVIEVWKTFLREEDQSKYFIPMQFSVRGVPVTSRRLRLTAGTAYVGMVVAAFAGLLRAEAAGATLPLPSAGVAIGLVVGMVIALGGAWKDAPTEGFSALKFLRSPALTVLCAVALSFVTASYLEIGVAAIGFERAIVETYKKFCFPTTAPGKFAGRPVLYPEMFVRRRRFVPAYVAIWAAVLLSGIVAGVEATGHVARPGVVSMR